jgi:hypothetical protein
MVPKVSIFRDSNIGSFGRIRQSRGPVRGNEAGSWRLLWADSLIAQFTHIAPWHTAPWHDAPGIGDPGLGRRPYLHRHAVTCGLLTGQSDDGTVGRHG